MRDPLPTSPAGRPERPEPSRRRPVAGLVLPILVVVLAVLAAFAPAFRAEFLQYDDNVNFVGNERFRGLSGEHLRWMFTTGWMGHYQPLSWVTLGADWLAAGGLDGPAFHRTNLLLHALGAVLFFFLARRLLAAGGGAGGAERVPAIAGPGLLAATFATLVFAVHPLRVESVAWITERRDVLSGVFFLATLVAWAGGPANRPLPRYGRGRVALAIGLAVASAGLFFAAVDLSVPETLALRPGAGALLPLALAALGALTAAVRPGPRGAAAVALLVLSLGAKAWGLVMPALLLVLDFWPRRRGRIVDALVEKLPFAVPAIAFAALAAWAQAGLFATLKTLEQHGPLERLAQAFYGLAFYPAKTLVPISLGPFYQLPDRIDLLAPRFLLPTLAVIVGAVALLRGRRRFPAGVAAAAAYAITISPVLGLVQSGPQLVAERYSYLAGLPFALLAGAGVGAWARRRPRGAAIGALVVVLALGALTFRQTEVWSTSRSLWAHTQKVRPDHSSGWLYLATLEEEEAAGAPPAERVRRFEEACRLLEEGMARSDDPKLPGALSTMLGRLADEDPARADSLRALSVEMAARALEEAAAQGDFHPRLLLTHGEALVSAGRPAAARAPLEDYVARQPGQAAGRIVLGRALIETGRPAEARRHLEEAIRLAPDDPGAWRWLARARGDAGDREGARQAAQRALRLAPGDPEVRALLQELLR
jgi:tetratricopeptide (TPR) repeat protein